MAVCPQTAEYYNRLAADGTSALLPSRRTGGS
jgi:hypothetical protein